MKKKILSMLLVFMLSMTMFTLLASAQTTLKLNLKSATLGTGETLELEAKTNSSDTVKWNSDDTKVATVSRQGVVRARSEGTASITASVGGESVKIKITVKKAPESVSAGKVTVSEGATERIKLRFNSGSASRSRTYESADKTIATVNSNGTVKGIKEGTTTITVTAFNGITTEVNVSVKKAAETTVTETTKDNPAVTTTTRSTTAPVFTQRCTYCAGNHNSSSCNIALFCTTCGGRHMPGSRCPLQTIATQATTVYKPPATIATTQWRPPATVWQPPRW